MRIQGIIPPAIAISNDDSGQIRPIFNPYQEIEQARQYCPNLGMVEGTGSETDPFRLRAGVLGNTVSPYAAAYRLWELLRVQEGHCFQVTLPNRPSPAIFRIMRFGVLAVPSGVGTAFAQAIEDG
ncbi:hypothetical protein HYW17_02110 [Candidatus Uhrbacteria bacterium]|nr:hypothetical protein [Candidatus Uhrbacteria bacterium]